MDFLVSFELDDEREVLEFLIERDVSASGVLSDREASFCTSAFKASAGSTSPIFDLLALASDLNPPLRRRPPLFLGAFVLGV